MRPFEWWENKKQEKLILSQISETAKRYKETFKTEDAKAVLDDLARICFENITTFDNDAKRMAFNEGRRSVYKYILGMINKDLGDIQEELTSG